MNSPLVSIIIPVYNDELFIEDALRSIQNQTYKHWECIVVDDGSADNTPRLVASYASDSRIIYHHQCNQGVSAARNKGIQMALGEYMFFLDADDTLSSTCLQVLIAENGRDTVFDMVIGAVRDEGLATSQILPPPTPHQEGGDTTRLYNNNEVRKWYYGSGVQRYGYACNILLRSGFVRDNHLLFEPNIRYEDTLWTFDAVNSATTVCILQQETYLYRNNPQSFSNSTDWVEKDKAFMHVLRMIAQRIKPPYASMIAAYYTISLLDIYRSHSHRTYMPVVKALCSTMRQGRKGCLALLTYCYFRYNQALKLRHFEPLLRKVLWRI